MDRMLLSTGDPQQQIVSFPTGSDARPSDPPGDENRPVARCVAMADFSKFADDVISQNAKDGHWDDKTQRQVRSIAGLFVRFMLQDQHVQDLNSLRQLRFVDFLRSEIYVHYGTSAQDEHLTIAQMREDALSRNKNKRGIGGDTLNRHLTNLSQIFRHAAASGAEALAPPRPDRATREGQRRSVRETRKPSCLSNRLWRSSARRHSTIVRAGTTLQYRDWTGCVRSSMVFLVHAEYACRVQIPPSPPEYHHSNLENNQNFVGGYYTYLISSHKISWMILDLSALK